MNTRFAGYSKISVKPQIPTLLLFMLVSTTSLAQLKAFKTYKVYEEGKPSLTRDGVHMNGAFKGEGEMVKFVDADDKKIDFEPKEYWGFLYDTVLFRCIPDKQMNYAAVRKVGENLYFHYRGESDLKLMANREAFGPRYADEIARLNGMHGLLETNIGFAPTLNSPVVLWNDGKKDFHEVLGRYYKEDAIDEFKKAIFKASTDKERYEAMMALLKGAKK